MGFCVCPFLGFCSPFSDGASSIFTRHPQLYPVSHPGTLNLSVVANWGCLPLCPRSCSIGDYLASEQKVFWNNCSVLLHWRLVGALQEFSRPQSLTWPSSAKFYGAEQNSHGVCFGRGPGGCSWSCHAQSSCLPSFSSLKPAPILEKFSASTFPLYPKTVRAKRGQAYI